MRHSTTTRHTCPACEIGEFTRNNYFNGKLLVERDFTDEQRYYVDKLRHHNKSLHGSGVVCGLKVKQHPNENCQGRYVVVEPGSAIDCCGHDILVPEETYVDITVLDPIKELEAKKDTAAHTLQICLRYKECPTEEIPVLYDDCGCDDTKCAPNRILESYDIGVKLDQKDDPEPVHTPQLQWKNSIGVAHAAGVMLHDTSHRLYVLTADNPATVYQISSDNYATITSRTLPARVLAQAISTDGKHLYVVVEPTEPATLRQLYVLDTAQAGMPDFNANALDLPNSSGSDVELVVERDGRLLTLVSITGDVLRWPADLDTNMTPTAPEVIKNIGNGLSGLTLSNDGKQAFALGPGNQIQSLDLNSATVNPVVVLPAGAKPSVMVLVTSTGHDMLMVGDQTKSFLHLIALSPTASLVSSVKLDHPPIGLIAPAGGHWVYVLEKDTDSVVQSFNIDGLMQKLSEKPSEDFKVGKDSRQIAINSSGNYLYVPYVDDLTKSALGGVAVVELSEASCPGILWRHLNGCPHCDAPNCVVLATITDYHVGDKFVDAVIDNRKGRHLLASTQVLTELVECLLEHGTNGTPGKDGKDGKDGAGLETGLTRIVDLSWKHNSRGEKVDDSSPIAGFVKVTTLGRFHQNDSVKGRDQAIGIVIVFDAPVRVYAAKFISPNFLHRLPQIAIDGGRVLEVSTRASGVKEPEDIFDLPLFPLKGVVVPVTWAKEGEVESNVQFKWDLPLREIAQQDARAIAWIPPETVDISKESLLAKIPIESFFAMTNEIWVRLRGDFVIDRNGNAADVEFARAALPTGDRPKPPQDKFGIQGGLFESWFWVSSPPAGGSGGRGFSPNAISPLALAAVPGMTLRLYSNILAARETRAFTNAADFRSRVQPTEEEWQAIRPQISFRRTEG